MSLESAIADLVSASTSLVSAVNVTRTTLENTEATVAAQVQPAAASATEAANQATAASNSVTAAKASLTTAASDYAAQKTAKGLPAVQSAADSELADRLHRRDPARYPFRGARPSLVLDFVRRECHKQVNGELQSFALGDVMTFTRSSTATYTGPDGLLKTAEVNEPRYDYDPITGECRGLLIEEQRTNLSNNSGFMSSNYWSLNQARTTPPSQINPAGNLQGCILYPTVTGTNSAPRLEGINLTYSPASAITISATCTAGSAPIVHVCGFNSATGWFVASVDLSSGTVIKTGAGSDGVFIACVVNKIGNGYRVSVTGSISSGTVVRSGIGMGISQNPTYVNYGHSSENHSLSGYINIHDVQTELGLFPTSYIPTPATFTGRASTATYLDSNGVLQTAASGVARSNAYGYDSDGVLRPIGLLLEGAATNLALNSGTFTGWGLTQLGVAGAKITAPDGTLSGVPLVPNVGAAINTYATQMYFGSFAPTTYAASIYAKRGGLDQLRLRMVDNASASSASAIVSLVDGSLVISPVDTAAWVGVSVNVTKCNNGWFRVRVSGTCVGTGTVTIGVMPYDSTLTSGDGVSGVYVWGAQLEAGSYATSYIPTTTAQVTRAADTSTSAQVTRGADDAHAVLSSYRSEGVVTCFEAHQSKNGEYPGLGGWHNDTFIYNRPPSNVLNANSRGGVSGVPIASPTTAGSKLRYALLTNRSTLRGSANGSNPVGWNVTLPPTAVVNTMSIGHGGSHWNSCIRSITVFPRALSDTDLQALTILEN